MARLALLSTSDKTGLIDLAKSLVTEFDYEIISSGGTAKTLKDAGISVTKVSDYTGFPEILGGRVKTLHPRIHGGILARKDLPQDVEELNANNIRPIDLVVVNLYPFEQTISKPEVTLAEAIEKIDIGGPAMLRASAKNFAHLTVLCNPSQYNSYLEELRKNAGEVSLKFRQKCALTGFQHTATYDQAIATYLQEQQTISDSEKSEKEIFFLSGKKVKTLRYGENPHQYATWYQRGINTSGWGTSKIIQGKELSYNNLVDLEAARKIITEFSDAPTVAILKHTNPCGVAVDETLLAAYERAFAGDSISAFGGIVALNKSIDAATAKAMTKTFLECVVAPGCELEAEDFFKSKSKLRVLISPDLKQSEPETIKVISGGFLVQDSDNGIDNYSDWKIVTEKQPTAKQMEELMFAWKVVKHVKSNAIVVTKNRATVGIGAGQMNRVGAVKIALEQAGEKAIGGILASDAFFPFDDSVKTAAVAGITAIIQPGGSLKDKDSIAAANKLGLVMILTGIRHFLH